jgi:hypothetical protein
MTLALNEIAIDDATTAPQVVNSLSSIQSQSSRLSPEK